MVVSGKAMPGAREAVETISLSIDRRLSDHGFQRLQNEARWIRPRLQDFHDCFVVSYGTKNYPAVVHCSPMISVRSDRLLEEVRIRFGASFAKNDFGAVNIGQFMPGSRFMSWACEYGAGGDNVGREITDAFFLYGLPVLEKISDYATLREFVERQHRPADDHSELLSLVAPSCLAYLEGDQSACKRYLERMLLLDQMLIDGEAWLARFRPKRVKIAKFLSSI